MKKVCTKCKCKKDESQFARRRGSQRQPMCMICNREYQKRHYINNRSTYLTKARKYDARVLKEARDLIFSHLSQNPCVDCGEDDIVILEFDHVRGKKEFTITEIRRAGFSLAKIKAEIAKCDVVCANCHRRRTAKTFQSLENTDRRCERRASLTARRRSEKRNGH